MSEEAMSELMTAFREQPNQEKSAVIFIHPDVQKRINLATDVSFLGLIVILMTEVIEMVLPGFLTAVLFLTLAVIAAAL